MRGRFAPYFGKLIWPQFDHLASCYGSAGVPSPNRVKRALFRWDVSYQYARRT
jgi:hypothetical protein